jgi:hypothetical protein
MKTFGDFAHMVMARPSVAYARQKRGWIRFNAQLQLQHGRQLGGEKNTAPSVVLEGKGSIISLPVMPGDTSITAPSVVPGEGSIGSPARSGRPTSGHFGGLGLYSAHTGPSRR